MSEKVSVLDRQVSYSGDGISLKNLETMIEDERGRQDIKVEELKTLRTRNVELSRSLEVEVKKLRKLSDYVSSGQLTKGGALASVKELLSYIPGLRRLAVTRRSVEELLRQQYEISSMRVKEAAEFADRLEAAEGELYDEIERLNGKIIEAAKNEASAADYVLELQEHLQALEDEKNEIIDDDVAVRELEREIDRTRRVLTEHSTQLQLYHTAENRLDRLKKSTDMLGSTIANLRSDISQYVMAASEKLDLVGGQIRAIGTAADASVVILEMKKSLDSMSESLNDTTRFVAETQSYFRQNLDTLINDLDVYDDETRAALEHNLAMSRAAEQQRIAEAVDIALQYKQTHDDADAPTP